MCPKQESSRKWTKSETSERKLSKDGESHNKNHCALCSKLLEHVAFCWSLWSKENDTVIIIYTSLKWNNYDTQDFRNHPVFPWHTGKLKAREEKPCSAQPGSPGSASCREAVSRPCSAVSPWCSVWRFTWAFFCSEKEICVYKLHLFVLTIS